MSLASSLTAAFQQIGADIKALLARAYTRRTSVTVGAELGVLAPVIGTSFDVYALVFTTGSVRIRGYTSAAARTADASRQPGTDPSVSGVVFDYVSTVGGAGPGPYEFPLSPLGQVRGQADQTLYLAVSPALATVVVKSLVLE